MTVGPGKWREKIYHFHPDKPPSAAGAEVHSEFFVDYKDFRTAIEALYLIKDTFAHLVQISEFRLVARDDIPMSPAYGRDVVGIHFTW